MKKIIALVCVAALALVCVAGCSSSSNSSSSSSTSNDTYVSEWKVDSVQAGAVSVDISEYFKSFSLKFNSDDSYAFSYELADGSRTLNAAGSPWELTSTGIRIPDPSESGSYINFTADGDKLVYELPVGELTLKINMVKK